jgi:hypothetical protein
MFPKVNYKLLISSGLFLVLLILTSFLGYKFYQNGKIVTQNITQNNQILNQNGQNLENLLRQNSKDFEDYEKTLQTGNFEKVFVKIQKLEENTNKFQEIKTKIPEMINFLEKDENLENSKELHKKAKQVLESRNIFLENLILVQKSQVCNLNHISKASSYIYFINQKSNNLQSQTDINIYQEMSDNFNKTSQSLDKVKDCFNTVNEEYKTEEFLKDLKTDVDFFKNQAKIFEDIKIGITSNNTEKLKEANQKLEENGEKTIQIFTNEDYQKGFEQIFEAKILDLDKNMNQDLEQYQKFTSDLERKYWVSFF